MEVFQFVSLWFLGPASSVQILIAHYGAVKARAAVGQKSDWETLEALSHIDFLQVKHSVGLPSSGSSTVRVKDS